MLNVEQYLKFIVEHKLTQQQFLLLYLLRLKEVDKKQAIELIKLYKTAFPLEGSNQFITKTLLADLIKKGFLIQIVPDRADIDNYQIGSKFDDIFIDEYEAGNQFWNKYPAIITSDGRNYPMKMMDKNEFRKLYWKAIGGDKDEHEEILKDLDYAILKNMIRGKIENFLKSEQWTEIRKVRLGLTTPIQGSIEERDF